VVIYDAEGDLSVLHFGSRFGDGKGFIASGKIHKIGFWFAFITEMLTQIKMRGLWALQLGKC
jgi:hypothetical protein